MTATRQGMIYAFLAYGLWTFFPVYLKLLDGIAPLEILSHRIIWACVLTVPIIAVLRSGGRLKTALTKPKQLGYLMLSTLFIATNWGVFIWAVSADQILSASLGYYINPLFSILLGMVFFAEKLSASQRVAAILCCLAVALEIWNFGELPWVALLLAGSFGLYGVVRKKVGVDSLTGMAVESGALAPLALGYLLIAEEASNPLTNPLSLNLLLVLAGPFTMAPLMLFAAAANRVSLTTLGFFQYIAPTGMFLLATLAYGEALVPAKLLTFAIIWSALLLLIWDGMRQLKPRARPAARLLS